MKPEMVKWVFFISWTKNVLFLEYLCAQHSIYACLKM